MDARRREIMDRIHSDYELLESRGHTVLGVFLYGSQNYGMDYEDSDIDTKAIVLPSFEDFVMVKKPVSITLTLENNEQIDIKDLRLMFENIKKQNINFVEILFTEFYYINPEFEDLFKKVFDNREQIARYNEHKAINCMIGMAMEKHKALEHPYPSTIRDIERFKFSPKQVHHVVRMKDFLIKYTNRECFAYKNCLIPSEKEWMIDIKRGIEGNETMSVERARTLCEYAIIEMKSVGNKYIEKLKEPYDNEAISGLMDDVIIDIMKKHFHSELFMSGCGNI